MDTQQPSQQTQTPPPPAMQPPTPVPTPPLPKKPNKKGLLIVFFLVIASLGLGAASFLIPQKNTTTQVTSGTPTPTIITAEIAQWKKYSDFKYNYYFYYPDTWALSESANDPSGFELRYTDSTKPGVITGKFLSKEEQEKTLICQNVDNKKQICKSAPISTTTKSYMEVNIENNEPQKLSVMIARPNNVLLFLQVTEPNFDSYQTVAIMLDTIKFQNEARINKIPLCPDSWSADKKTITYHGATFAADEIDQEFIKTDCKM